MPLSLKMDSDGEYTGQSLEPSWWASFPHMRQATPLMELNAYHCSYIVHWERDSFDEATGQTAGKRWEYRFIGAICENSGAWVEGACGPGCEHGGRSSGSPCPKPQARSQPANQCDVKERKAGLPLGIGTCAESTNFGMGTVTTHWVSRQTWAGQRYCGGRQFGSCRRVVDCPVCSRNG